MGEVFNIDHMELHGAVVNKGVVNVADNRMMYDNSSTETLLKEIADAQKKLADKEPIIAQSLDELRKAIEKGDEKTKAEKVKVLSVGFVADVMKKVAGGVLLHFLGIG